MRILLLICCCWLWRPVGAASEATPPTPDCVAAAAKAEARYGIPGRWLQAITLVETGRGDGKARYAWPWTTNIASEGRYFENKSDVAGYIRKNIRAGVKSIDVGCFQINTKWHGEHFSSIDDMLDPALAADYAARFLVDLKGEFGDWNTAAKTYHSRQRSKRNRYGHKLADAKKFLRHQKNATNRTPFPALREIEFTTGASNGAGGVDLSVFTDRTPLFDQDQFQRLIEGGERSDL